MPPLFPKKILYAILSGLMLTVAFPPGKLEWIVWIALVPLLKSLDNQSPSQAFRLGCIAGLSHYLTLIYWIVEVLKHYGGLHVFVSVLVLLLFCLYLSLYLGLFSFLTVYMKRSPFAIFMIASLWVGLEYIRAKALTGFPWCLLGHTQFRHLDLIQISDLTGVYGLSFLIVLSNAMIYFIIFSRDSHERRHLKWEIPMVLLTAFFILAYGHHRLKRDETGGKGQESIKIAIIQGNIDQSIKWDPAFQEKTVTIYRRLTQRTHSFKPRLVVWPETSMPFFFQDDRNLSPKIIKISKESGADLIFGSPAYRREDGRTKLVNRAYLLSPNGEIYGYYDKVHLVPFGEYVPLKRFLPFIHRLVQAAGDFVSGKKIEPLNLPYLSAGILICYEVIFPELARAHVKKGAEILINLTNDAWFGMTSAPYQHLCMSVFRAVENRKPLIRVANTGFSAFISPQGEMIIHGDLFREEVLELEVRGGDSTPGFYTRYGDVFASSLLGISLITVFYILCYNGIRNRKEGG